MTLIGYAKRPGKRKSASFNLNIFHRTNRCICKVYFLQVFINNYNFLLKLLYALVVFI